MGVMEGKLLGEMEMDGALELSIVGETLGCVDGAAVVGLLVGVLVVGWLVGVLVVLVVGWLVVGILVGNFQ